YRRRSTVTRRLPAPLPWLGALLAIYLCSLGDEILVLDQGRVLQTGTTEAVFKRPASETVARLLGAENVAFGIAVDEDQIEIGNGVRLAVAGEPMVHGERVGWSVRPEDIRLGDDGCYEGTIQDV